MPLPVAAQQIAKASERDKVCLKCCISLVEVGLHMCCNLSYNPIGLDDLNIQWSKVIYEAKKPFLHAYKILPNHNFI